MKYTIAFAESGVWLFSKTLSDPMVIMRYKGYHGSFSLTDKLVIAFII